MNCVSIYPCLDIKKCNQCNEEDPTKCKGCEEGYKLNNIKNEC